MESSLFQMVQTLYQMEHGLQKIIQPLPDIEIE
jgi:hypothetical protein